MSRRLVTLLTDKADDAHLARRTLRYDHLVLIVHPGAEPVADAVARHEVGLGGLEPDRHAVPTDGFEATVDLLHASLSNDDVVLNAAGGSPLVVTAALLVAYARGVETWFCQEGRAVRLPVVEGMTLADRLSEDQRGALRALETETEARVLAERLQRSRHQTEVVLRQLRRAGLVDTRSDDGRMHARRSASGDAVLQHLDA